jgi:aryl-alcohol dehydrogenase-like predicted oxidoreductase
MKKRKLGNSSIEVTPLCLGGNVFGWTIDEKRSFEILDAFISAGFDFIDTADVYSRWASGVGGESETILGKWMKSRNNRSKVILATKVGFEMGETKVGLSKKYILSAVEDSLRRLQTDYIDLYQSHKDDENIPQKETLEAFQILIKAGKVRAIGASNFPAARLNESLTISKEQGLPRYDTLQPLYNLYDREVFEKELEGVCLKHNIGVINYYSLAAGFLSGKYRNESDSSKSLRGHKAKTYMTDRGLKILKTMDLIAEKNKVSLSSVAVAWLLSKPVITAPIASATTIDQLEALIKATEISLSPEDISNLDKASEWK